MAIISQDVYIGQQYYHIDNKNQQRHRCKKQSNTTHKTISIIT